MEEITRKQYMDAIPTISLISHYLFCSFILPIISRYKLPIDSISNLYTFVFSSNKILQVRLDTQILRSRYQAYALAAIKIMTATKYYQMNSNLRIVFP